MEEGEVVYIKVFDEERGDVVFEGKVSTDVEPFELVKLGCFWERHVNVIFNKATNEEVKSFKGLQNSVELVADTGVNEEFSGVLSVGADDGVLRKSESALSSECVLLSLWKLSHEECEKAFKCETLEELEIYDCDLMQIPKEIGNFKNLKKLTLYDLLQLESLPEEIGELSSLEELRIEWCEIENLPKKLNELKMLKLIHLVNLSKLLLNAEDLVVFSKLKHLTIWNCSKLFTPSFTQSFWEMIRSMADLRVLDLDWYKHGGEMVAAALEENGSIVEGGGYDKPYTHFFQRNRDNHERAMVCVLQFLAIRRWRSVLNSVPKEMIHMLAMMLWNTRCDVGVWNRK